MRKWSALAAVARAVAKNDTSGGQHEVGLGLGAKLLGCGSVFADGRTRAARRRQVGPVQPVVVGPQVLPRHFALGLALDGDAELGRRLATGVAVLPSAQVVSVHQSDAAAEFGGRDGAGAVQVGVELHANDCRSFCYVASSAVCYGISPVARATVPPMRSTPEKDARLRARLEEAVKTFAGGSADKFGRLLGYTNGGYIREILQGKKPMRGAMIERAKEQKALPALQAWFDGALLDTLIVTPADADHVTQEPAARYGAAVDLHPPITPEERQLIEAVRELLPDEAIKLLAPIYEHAEHMRRVKAFVLERSGATAIASPAQVQHIPKAPPYSGPRRTDGPERRQVDEPHAAERRGVVLRRSGGVVSRGAAPAPAAATAKRKTG